MPMWATGSNALKGTPTRNAAGVAVGFTLVELLAAITIVGMLLAFAVPASMKFFESMQYRQAVREVITVLGSARHAAIDKGTYQDVVIHPAGRRLTFNGRKTQLPKELQLAVHSAREVNRENAGVIRFYPEGGSSGGSIDIERPEADGVRISVDWLAGRVTQERYATE
jgi:general secretion pathway protein H